MKMLYRPALALGLALLTALQVGAAEFSQRLTNLSTRTFVGSGNNVALVGFVIGPGAPKQVLIRAVGPGLATYGVSGFITNPRVDLYDSAGKAITGLSNDNWTTATVGGAGTFGSVGAFPLATGSLDGAILVTLAPGLYTAQVSGVGTATGVALVEIYDVTGPARLINLSTRAQIGTGSAIMISGLSIAADAGRRQILVRVAGPTLSALGVPGAISDPIIAIVDSNNVQVATNDNWGSDNTAALTAAFASSGAFPFGANSKDAALITDLGTGNYSIQVSGVGGATGLALIEVYDITPSSFAAVTVAASTAVTDTKGGAPGVYTFARTGSTASPLTIFYNVSGSALPGADYSALPGSVTIPAGASTVTVNLSPRTDGASDTISRTATVSLNPGAGYTIGTASAASVTIFYNPGTNYIASLRVPATVVNSTAFGTATVQLSGDGKFAVVNVDFSGLSAPETVAYLRLGNPGEVGTEVLRLNNGQVNDTLWTFGQSGAFSAADLVQALKDGRIFLSIETSAVPSGELKGTFIQNSASLVYNPPAASPQLADVPLTAAEASRFLAQATFGPTKAEVDALTGKRQTDLNNWITAQLALPPSLQLTATDADFTSFTAAGETPAYSQANRQAAWWKLTLTAPDQLRQRVAFALSEILVVSDVNGTLANNPRAMANYYDILVRGASGNFRTMLEEVSMSPIMGVYLSSLRNAKATFDSKGAIATSPDENYAREIMQLFTIGLNQVQPDGTLKLEEMRGVKEELQAAEQELAAAEAARDEALAAVPNPPDDSAPDGFEDEDAVELRRVGEPGPESKEHTEIGRFDMERAARLSGSRFGYLLGDTALVAFALYRYALGTAAKHGHTPMLPPVLVREDAMYGTGFFPTERSNIYAIESDELYLTGTSEVALAGFHMGEILEQDELPLRYTAFSTNFRREAGAAGKDTRGMFRVHQFNKVELFVLCEPGVATDEHERLVGIEEEILQGLGLPYRVVNVAAGDLGAPAVKKYDIEGWFPSQQRYRELTSASNTTDFQARRLGIRYRAGKDLEPVNTLNGTATTDRTLLAILENFGGDVPDVLREYGAPERVTR